MIIAIVGLPALLGNIPPPALPTGARTIAHPRRVVNVGNLKSPTVNPARLPTLTDRLDESRSLAKLGSGASPLTSPLTPPITTVRRLSSFSSFESPDSRLNGVGFFLEEQLRLDNESPGPRPACPGVERVLRRDPAQHPAAAPARRTTGPAGRGRETYEERGRVVGRAVELFHRPDKPAFFPGVAIWRHLGIIGQVHRKTARTCQINFGGNQRKESRSYNM